MTDNILMSIIMFIGRVLVYSVVDIMGFYTGEIILYIISFGSKKPRWDYYVDDSYPRFVIFTEITTWVGFVFWFSVIFFVAMIT